MVNFIVDMLDRLGLLRRDLDYHLLRAVMVIIFAWFGWDKWHVEEIQQLVPLIAHGPLIFWTIPVLGVRGTSILLGASEWTFGLLLLPGFWRKWLGVLGALGSIATFVATSRFSRSRLMAGMRLQGGSRPCRSRAPSCLRTSSCWLSPSTCSSRMHRA